MKVLVTGADGFAGRHLLAALGAAGHEVHAATRAGGPPPPWRDEPAASGVHWTNLELGDDASVAALARQEWDGVVHLAALASGAEARLAPLMAWQVNTIGTVRLLEAFASARAAGVADPLVLVVSSGEVYGVCGPAPVAEHVPTRPISAYAASKLAAEVGALEIHRRTGLRVLVVRPFAHTGPGQSPTYAIPAFAERLRAARRAGRTAISTGDLSPVRDYLDVRDVARAYVALLALQGDGEVFNIASGQGRPLEAILRELATTLGVTAMPVTDPALVRTGDLPHLVGDAAKLRAATGWAPTIPFSRTLRDLVDAQAD